MNDVVIKTFEAPDTVMDMIENITLDMVDVGGIRLTRVTAAPGWRWSVHSQPVQQTPTCQLDHVMYLISGRVGSSDSTGRQSEYSAGDIAHIPPDHDGWTVGDRPAVWIEIPH